MTNRHDWFILTNMKPMTEAQRSILRAHLDDETIDISQIYFLEGGNISQASLTIVYEQNDAVEPKRFRYTDVYDQDGNTVSAKNVNVNATLPDLPWPTYATLPDLPWPTYAHAGTPRGIHVRYFFDGVLRLGEVRDVYWDSDSSDYKLAVQSFNGERVDDIRWQDSRVLQRTYEDADPDA